MNHGLHQVSPINKKGRKHTNSFRRPRAIYTRRIDLGVLGVEEDVNEVLEDVDVRDPDAHLAFFTDIPGAKEKRNAS